MLKKIMVAVVLLVYKASAQNTYSVSSGLNLVPSGGVHVVLSEGVLVNNGNYTDASGNTKFVGGVTFSGSGTTSLNNLEVSHSGGTTTLNSSLTTNQLIINGGSTISIAASQELSVKASLTNNSSVTGDGVINMSGSSAQNISGTGYVDNIKVDNSNNVTVVGGASMNIRKGLFPISGKLVSNGANVVLESDASGDAIVHAKSGACSQYIDGSVTIKRYIPVNSNDTYRFLGTPFSEDKLFSDWVNLPGQPSGLTRTYLYNSTFASPNPSASGGDPAWSKASLSTTWAKYKGAISFFTGGATTISAAGQLNQCTVTIPLAATYHNGQAGYVLVSNPYASYLNLESHASGQRSNILNGFYVFDPSTSSSDGSSQKSVQSGFNSNGKYKSIVPGVSGGGNPTKIPPYSSFFVKLDGTNTSGTLTFNESDKSSDSNIGFSAFRTNGEFVQNQINRADLKAFTIQIVEDKREIDDFKLIFRPEATDGTDAWDLPKMLNSNLNLFSKNINNAQVGVDTRRSEDNFEELQLYLTTDKPNSDKTLQLVWNEEGVSRNYDYYLTDMSTRVKIKLENGLNYPFRLSSEDKGKPRFLIQKKSAEELEKESILVKPNPIESDLIIDFSQIPQGEYELEMSTIEGGVVQKIRLNTQKNLEYYFDATHMNRGLYLLKMSNEKNVYTGRFIKN